MSAAGHQIALPEELMHEAARHADSLGISTEQWLEAAVAERLRLEEKTAVFFRERASLASGRSLTEILSRSNDNSPMPGDELEA